MKLTDIKMKKVNGTFVADTIEDTKVVKKKSSKGVVRKSGKLVETSGDQLNEFLSGFNLVADVLRKM